ncbi:MAG: hypothetical protein AB7P23_00865 [Amphiplicatus sp.]
MSGRRALFPLLAAIAAASAPAVAQSFSAHGLAQARLVAPSGERSYLDGGFGKLRYGEPGARDIDAQASDLFLEGRAQLTPALFATATLKHDPEQIEAVDIVEGYLRYRPASSNPLRWAVKAGAFFPPISFENDGLGWVSAYSLTPSAINAWVGEELRAIGAETALEWRMTARTVSLAGAVYGWNDPTGVLLADRGWALTDRVTGLLDRVRLPDAFAAMRRVAVPLTETEFLEMDGRPGWYAALEWEERDGPIFRAMRYDNNADPAAREKGQIAWRTAFWSAGASIPLGSWTVIAQAMTGMTEIEPAPNFVMTTDFDAAFALLSRDIGDFRVTGRVDAFRTRETATPAVPRRREDGKAGLIALSWFASEHLRLTGEALFVTSTRPERVNDGENPKADETQFQASLQLSF